MIAETSKTKNPVALVIAGDGINCEHETVYGCSLAGFNPVLVHISVLLLQPELLEDCSMLVLPGGFSFGDEIASGRVVAVKIMEKLKEQICRYIEGGNLVLGICNGFQALVQMGVLPEPWSESRPVTLTHNSGGRFINKWVSLDVSDQTNCRFFRNLKTIDLPIRHGEGRLVASTGYEKQLKSYSVLRYSEDVNGSLDRIAALTNASGNVVGMMPHPEAFVRWSHHPAWTAMKARRRFADDKTEAKTSTSISNRPSGDEPHGLAILKNAYDIAVSN